MALDAQALEILMLYEKILVVQTAFIGDSVLTLPLIQSLSSLFPSSLIDVISAPASEEIFKASPFVHKVIVYDKRGADKSLISIFHFAGRIRNEKYSVIYSPHRSLRTAMLVKLSGVKETYGFSNSSLSRLYRNVIPYHGRLHEVQRNLSLTGCYKEGDEWKIKPEIQSDEKTVRKIDGILYGYEGRKFATVAPGSVWETKKYPVERYKGIVEFLLGRGIKVFLIGAKSDRALCDELSAGHAGDVVNVAGNLTITESVELLRRCSVLICNDSAPAHFGMAAGIAVLTIYCSTVPDFGFYPYNEKSRIMNFDELKCKPCGIHGHKKCPVKSFDCAYKISESEVNDIIAEMLDD